MRRLVLALAGAAALAAAPAASGIAAPAQAQQDWAQTVAATPEGGLRVGNPAAPTRLVEFVSLTCGHCRAFAEAGMPVLLRDYVGTGRLSFEVRPYPLDVVAEVAAQVTQCAAPRRALALQEAILTSQDQWFPRLETLTDAEVKAIQSAPAAEQRQRIAALLGFDALASRHGLPADKAKACLADEAGARRIQAAKAAAERLGVDSTPTFVLNGRVLGPHDWTSLQKLLGQP